MIRILKNKISKVRLILEIIYGFRNYGVTFRPSEDN